MNLNIIITLITVQVFICLNLIAQPNIEWQQSYGGSDTDIGHDIEHTPDGGYIIAGQTRSTDGDVSIAHGFYDYWVAKISSDGSLEWERSYGGSHHDIAQDIEVTNDGGYIILGTSDSEDGQVSDPRNLSDFWIVKINSIGDIEWEKSLGGYNNDFGYAIEQTADGGYIVGGSSNSESVDVSNNYGNYDYWLVKLSSNGEMEWEKSLGGSKSDVAYSLRQTTDGGYILAGKSHSNDGDVTGNHDIGNFIHDFWIVKVDSLGQIEWQNSLGGSDHESAHSIQQTDDGGYIVTGLTRSTDGDVTQNFGDWDTWVVKLYADGNIEWQKTIGSYYDQIAQDIKQTTDGGYIIVGCSGDGAQVFEHKKFWAVKINSTGTIDWQQSYGGIDVDRALSVLQTEDEAYILAGVSDSDNGDITNSHGGSDVWVVKLGPCAVNTDLSIEEHTLVSQEMALSSSFQWINCSDNSPIVGANTSSFSPQQGGDYALIVSNGNCVDTSECINICPLNTALLIDDNTLVAVQDTSNIHFQWINCSDQSIIAGAIHQSFSPSLNGEYAVVISSENCTVTSDCILMCPEQFNTDIIETTIGLASLADTTSTHFQWINCSDQSVIEGANSPIFNPNSNGQYALIISKGACSITTDCIQFCIDNTDISVIDNSIISATDSLSSTYQWIDCDTQTTIEGATDYNFSPLTSGSYAVIVQQAECIDTSACVNITLVDTHTPSPSQVKIFPNPIQDFIIIDINKDYLGAHYAIYNQNGQEMTSGTLLTTHTRLNLNDLPTAIYTLKIKSRDGYLSHLLLVKSM